MKYTITDINVPNNAVAFRIDFTDKEIEKYGLRPAGQDEKKPIFDTQELAVDLREYDEVPKLVDVHDAKGKPVKGEDGQQLRVQVGVEQVKRDRVSVVTAAVEQRIEEYQSALEARQIPEDLNDLIGKKASA